MLQELLISGLPDIDVEDWENNTEYSGAYSTDSPVICVRNCTYKKRVDMHGVWMCNHTVLKIMCH